MTTENDLRPWTGSAPNLERSRYHLPYLSVREQTPAIPVDWARAVRPQYFSSPTQPADVAQAGLFADILRAEHAELGAAARLGARNRGAPCSAEQMMQLQSRMREVRRLLDALENRFLRS